jgi:hypothetical protein
MSTQAVMQQSQNLTETRLWCVNEALKMRRNSKQIQLLRNLRSSLNNEPGRASVIASQSAWDNHAELMKCGGISGRGCVSVRSEPIRVAPFGGIPLLYLPNSTLERRLTICMLGLSSDI